MASWFKRVQVNLVANTTLDNNTPTQDNTTIHESNTPQAPITQQQQDSVTQQYRGEGTPQGNSIKQGFGNIGGFFANVATKIITTLAEEKDRFLQETENSSLHTHVIPLWLALSGDPAVVEEARNAILNLTKSKRNFLNAPPEDCFKKHFDKAGHFTFDYHRSTGHAQAAVNADPKLNMARFCLVPTYIKEEEFWRNWFYRVQIILTAYGLEMPKENELPLGSSSPSSISSTASSSLSSVDDRLPFVDTTSATTGAQSPTLSVEDSLSKKIEKELGDLGIHTSESNPEAWEEELKRELSSIDPSKETPDSLLSQNWEEELMLELGLKNSPNAKDTLTTGKPTRTRTPSKRTTATPEQFNSNAKTQSPEISPVNSDCTTDVDSPSNIILPNLTNALPSDSPTADTPPPTDVDHPSTVSSSYTTPPTKPSDTTATSPSISNDVTPSDTATLSETDGTSASASASASTSTPTSTPTSTSTPTPTSTPITHQE